MNLVEWSKYLQPLCSAMALVFLTSCASIQTIETNTSSPPESRPLRRVDRVRVFATVPSKSQVNGAGTDANQVITVFGKDGFRVERIWDAAAPEVLERDRQSSFEIRFPNEYPCENLNKLVWLNAMDKGDRPGLFLSHVRIEACRGNQCWVVFDARVDRWLDSKEPAGAVMTLELKCPE